MAAQFHVNSVNSLGGALGLRGEVKKGSITEGAIGTTWENKKFKVVSISTSGGVRRVATTNEIVTIVVRNISKGDVSPGDTVFID